VLYLFILAVILAASKQYKDFMSNLPKLIKEILWETRWSQENLAEELDCTQPTISRIKAGGDCLNSMGDKIRALHLKHCKGKK